MGVPRVTLICLFNFQYLGLSCFFVYLKSSFANFIDITLTPNSPRGFATDNDITRQRVSGEREPACKLYKTQDEVIAAVLADIDGRAQTILTLNSSLAIAYAQISTNMASQQSAIESDQYIESCSTLRSFVRDVTTERHRVGPVHRVVQHSAVVRT